MTDRDRRALRLGGIVVGVYLVLFLAFQGGKSFAARRAEYLRLVEEAKNLEHEIAPYRDKAEVVKKLMDTYHFDPAQLSRATVVGQASAAIQQAAMGHQLQVGPVRESPARPGNKELGSMQLEAVGQVSSLMAFLRQTQTLGFPLVIESLQFTSDSNRPGPVKMNLILVILDFDQWKKEAGHA